SSYDSNPYLKDVLSQPSYRPPSDLPGLGIRDSFEPRHLKVSDGTLSVSVAAYESVAAAKNVSTSTYVARALVSVTCPGHQRYEVEVKRLRPGEATVRALPCGSPRDIRIDHVESYNLTTDGLRHAALALEQQSVDPTRSGELVYLLCSEYE